MEYLEAYRLFFYPNTIFISLIDINIQTMVHQGTMFIVGFARQLRVVKIEVKPLVRASSVSLTLVATAMLLNFLYNIFIGGALPIFLIAMSDMVITYRF